MGFEQRGKEMIESIMEQMGFAPDDAGPFVTELRNVVGHQVFHRGLIGRSAGTWAPGSESLTSEERAKEFLAWEWALNRGHSFRQTTMDGLWGWRTDVRTMKRNFHFRWRSVFPWLGDRCRETGMRYRVWRDRNLTNPYA